MKVTTQVLEAVTVLVPDSQTWGLSASLFFSLYCSAAAFGILCSADLNSALIFSSAFGYLVSFLLNIPAAPSQTSAPQITSATDAKSRVEETPRAALAQRSATTALSRSGR